MRKMLLCLCASCAMMGVAGCSDDEDATLVGIWNVYAYKSNERGSDGKSLVYSLYEGMDGAAFEQFVFNEDKTGEYWYHSTTEYMPEPVCTPLTYDVRRDTLFVTKVGESRVDTLPVLSLSGKSLELGGIGGSTRRNGKWLELNTVFHRGSVRGSYY